MSSGEFAFQSRYKHSVLYPWLIELLSRLDDKIEQAKASVDAWLGAEQTWDHKPRWSAKDEYLYGTPIKDHHKQIEDKLSKLKDIAEELRDRLEWFKNRKEWVRYLVFPLLGDHIDAFGVADCQRYFPSGCAEISHLVGVCTRIHRRHHHIPSAYVCHCRFPICSAARRALTNSIERDRCQRISVKHPKLNTKRA
jgi:hypothetical protein